MSSRRTSPLPTTSRTLALALVAASLLSSGARADSTYAVAPGPDPIMSGRLKVYDNGVPTEILPFSTMYGTYVAFADVNDDDHGDVLAGSGPAMPNPPRVRGFQATGTPLPGYDFLAYGSGQWGVQVAGVELPFANGEELVTLPGYGAPFMPQVRGWSYTGSSVQPLAKVNYFLSGMLGTLATLSHGDFNGDGYEEILTAERTNMGTWVMATSLATGGNVFRALVGGQQVHAAGGNVDGDPIDELLIGAQTSTGPRVRGFDVAGGLTAIARLNFIPFSCSQCSARPAVGNLDGDAYDEILVGSTQGDATVRAFNYDGALLTSMFQTTAYSGTSFGARPAINDSLY